MRRIVYKRLQGGKQTAWHAAGIFLAFILALSIMVPLQPGAGAADYNFELASPDNIVDIPDENLRTAVLEALGKIAGEDITVDEIAELILFYAGEKDIEGLAGLEHAVNLQYLYLPGNNISDISPLSELVNLKKINLYNNEISDISPLAPLDNLEWLNLGSNEISDTSPLAGSENLWWLVLYDNNISDISPLAGLENLMDLFLSSNDISDVTPLSGLENLIGLRLDDNDISDISPLAGLENLWDLFLRRNNISDISPLVGLEMLFWLYLDENEISDISPLAEKGNLERLSLGWNNISDFSPLVGAEYLWDLNLSHNKITAISPLTDLTNLKELNLENNQINDISALAANSNNGGLGEGDYVDLRHNFLDLKEGSSSLDHIQALNDNGVIVDYEPQKELTPLYGDVNKDGVIDVNDAILVLKHIVNIIDLEKQTGPEAIIRGDVNGNGVIDVGDAILILRHTVGIITEFPVEGSLNVELVVTVCQDTILAGEESFGVYIVIESSSLSIDPNDIFNFSLASEPREMFEWGFSPAHDCGGGGWFASIETPAAAGEYNVKIIMVDERNNRRIGEKEITIVVE